MNTTTESAVVTWKTVKNWEGVYEVSSDGEVRRTLRGTSTFAGRVLTNSPTQYGYLRVHLRHKGRQATRLVHNLVAEAFLGERPPKFEVNHKDGDTANPALSNLEYLSCRDNHLHAYRVLGRKPPVRFIGEINPASKLSDKQTHEVIRLYAKGKHTQKSLAARFGITQSRISQLVRRQPPR